jgi:phosphoribosylformimino-5-aminoimidazole carboxamide ribotide isomerase
MGSVVPSIDLLSGAAVRLRKGKESTAERLGEPISLAQKYSELGFSWLHIVDLDAAFGKGDNIRALPRMAEAKGKMKLQWGGGIRSCAAAEKALAAGADRVVFGTSIFLASQEVKDAALRFGSGRVWASLDFSGDPPMARVRGWQEGTGVGVADAIAIAEKCEIGGIMVSAIEQDGTMEGPDLSLLDIAVKCARLPVWLSGGMRDAKDAKRAFARGADGAIFGRALYGKNGLEGLACLQKG